MSTKETCWCTTCRPITLDDMRFVVCPECGNKRCPRAHNHTLACTNSNESGQPGSSWEHRAPFRFKKAAKHMTPRDQIQEHAQIAAAKVREAMAEFHKATGMRASIDVQWVKARLLASRAPRYLLEDVRLCIQDEAMG